MVENTSHGGKHFMIDPEKIEIGTWYELTLAPNNDLQCFGNKKRLNNFTRNNHLKLYSLLGRFDGKFIIEISKFGRLHLHGRISYEDDESIKHFFLNVINELMAHYTIALNPYRPKIWSEYIKKQAKFEWGEIDFTKDPLNPHDMGEVIRKTNHKQLSKLLVIVDE